MTVLLQQSSKSTVSITFLEQLQMSGRSTRGLPQIGAREPDEGFAQGALQSHRCAVHKNLS